MDSTYILAGRTDVGCVRRVNEDSMVSFNSPNGHVVAVCDGMGGQAAGDVASQLACNIISDILVNNRFATPTEAITRACIAANQGLLHRVSQNPELQGMGSTCVIIIIKDGLVYYGWIGDSRIYYVSNGSIQQLSRDQSYVQQLVDAGQISGYDAEHHPQKNEITNALGLDTMTPPELCVSPLKPEPGSVIMLCSDGLSGLVDADTMHDVIADHSMELQQRADALVDIAKANGGSDNITVQLVEFGVAQPATVPVPPPANSETKSKVMYLALIVAAAIVVGLGTWFLMGNDTKDKKTDTPSPAITAPVDNREDAKVVETPTVRTVQHETKTVETRTKSVRQEPAKPQAKQPKTTLKAAPKANANSTTTNKTTVNKAESVQKTGNQKKEAVQKIKSAPENSNKQSTQDWSK